MESTSHRVTMTTSLDMAARLNNRGAELLGAGDFVNARDLFRQALASLTVSARASLDAASTGCDTTLPNQKFSIDSLPWSKNRLSVRMQSDSTIPDSAIYDQAIPVPLLEHSTSSLTDYNSDDAFSQSLSSACCIFNLALIYHLRGTQMGSSNPTSQGANQRQHLLKAKSLYDKCSRLVFSLGLGCYIGRHPVADLLSMAVLNNHAHVCSELASYQAARECIECLAYITSLVRPCVYGNQDAEYFINEAKQTFCLNAFVLQPPSVAHAA